MSDVTFGVKVSPEVKEKVSAMIEASGLKSKEWFEVVLNAYELQRLKEGTADFSKDLSELEIHTNRINQLIVNMVHRATHEKEAVLQQIEGIKASKDDIIMGYQQELSEVKKQMQDLSHQAEQASQAREEVTKDLQKLEEAAENYRALIGEYKEKIDTLSGLVTSYKGASEENHKLREELSSLKQQAQEQTLELAKRDESLAVIEEKYSYKMADMESHCKDEIARLDERAAFEKERALLQLRTEYEERIAKLREERADRIEALQAEINQLRKNTFEKGGNNQEG